jgi:glucose-6-phosphate 1-dehydrogenase
VLVIFGASGDLTARKLLPAMEPRTSFHPEAIRDEKAMLLRAIGPLDEQAEIAANRCAGSTPAAAPARS